MHEEIEPHGCIDRRKEFEPRASGGHERGPELRVLVRDQRRLGSERVRVQIALGDLSDPASFRNALRGVETVIHLAASIRDQPRASMEELNGVGTLRLVQAAERARTKRFVFWFPSR